MSWFIRPAGQVIFVDPVEPLLVYLKVAFLGGIFLSLPLLCWEGWGFLGPAFLPRERRGFFLLVPMSVALFWVGAWFGWAVLLPSALKILLSFGSDAIIPLLTLGSYVSFAGWLILSCGLFFQMPIVLCFLTWLGVGHPRTLLRQWRVALVAILLIAAVLTPTPDIATQLLLAVPMSGLYLVSVGLAFLVPRRDGSML